MNFARTYNIILNQYIVEPQFSIYIATVSLIFRYLKFALPCNLYVSHGQCQPQNWIVGARIHFCCAPTLQITVMKWDNQKERWVTLARGVFRSTPILRITAAIILHVAASRQYLVEEWIPIKGQGLIFLGIRNIKESWRSMIIT